jgi:hypothetical protein
MMHLIVAAFDAAIAARQGKPSGFRQAPFTSPATSFLKIGPSEPSGVSGKSIYSVVRSENT